MKPQLCLLLVVLFSQATIADNIKPDDLPPAFTASYELLKNGLPVAETRYRFEKETNSATFTSNTELTGIAAWFSDEKASEDSQLSFAEQQVQVTHYHYQQSGKKEHTINSQFDHAAMQIKTKIDQQTKVKTAFTAPTWDKLSMLLALMSHAPSNKKELEINALDKTEIYQYQLRRTGEEEIELDEDIWIKTIRWERQHKNRKTVFFLDPKQYFIPIKIEQFKRDKRRATLLLKEIQWPNP